MSHKCNWHGCERVVERWQWGCSVHFGQLSPAIRDQLRTVKRHWPEYRKVNQRAIDFSKNEESVRMRKGRLCACGAPAAARLPAAECLDCHKKRFFNQHGE